jgi:hypothetical protein
MKSKSPKVQWFERELIVASFHLALCVSKQDYAQALKECGRIRNTDNWLLPGALATTRKFKNSNDRNQTIIVVCIDPAQFTNSFEIASCLVHEACHVFEIHCKLVGEKKPSSEFRAYAMQNITEYLFKTYYERTRKTGL